MLHTLFSKKKKKMQESIRTRTFKTSRKLIFSIFTRIWGIFTTAIKIHSKIIYRVFHFLVTLSLFHTTNFFKLITNRKYLPKIF